MNRIRFENRLQAGALLAKRLISYRRDEDAIILALPRGGVPVGFAMAEVLQLPLDVLVVRKLGIPGREEVAMGATARGGLCVLNAELVNRFDIPPEVIEAIAHREMREVERRENIYRSGRSPLQLENRVLIVVDDGLATGATMLAAVKTLSKANPAKIVVAVPVGPPESCRELEKEADEVVCLYEVEDMVGVSGYYADFIQTSDSEVLGFLQRAQWELRMFEEDDQKKEGDRKGRKPSRQPRA